MQHCVKLTRSSTEELQIKSLSIGSNRTGEQSREGTLKYTKEQRISRIPARELHRNAKIRQNRYDVFAEF